MSTETKGDRMGEVVATVETPAEVKIPAKAFNVIYAQVNETARYQLDRLAIWKDGRVACTDGHWLALVGDPDPKYVSETPRLVPEKTARLLSKADGDVTLTADGRLVATVSGAVVEARLADGGNFPAIDRVFEKAVEPAHHRVILNSYILERIGQMLRQMDVEAVEFEFPADMNGIVRISGKAKYGTDHIRILLMPMRA